MPPFFSVKDERALDDLKLAARFFLQIAAKNILIFQIKIVPIP